VLLGINNFITKSIAVLEENDYSLHDAEANILFPFLIEKVRTNKHPFPST
jgi:hypothetical protein